MWWHERGAGLAPAATRQPHWVCRQQQQPPTSIASLAPLRVANHHPAGAAGWNGVCVHHGLAGVLCDAAAVCRDALDPRAVAAAGVAGVSTPLAARRSRLCLSVWCLCVSAAAQAALVGPLCAARILLGQGEVVDTWGQSAVEPPARRAKLAPVTRNAPSCSPALHQIVAAATVYQVDARLLVWYALLCFGECAGRPLPLCRRPGRPAPRQPAADSTPVLCTCVCTRSCHGGVPAANVPAVDGCW